MSQRPQVLIVALTLIVSLASTAPLYAGETEAYTFLAEQQDRYFTGNQPRLLESSATPYPPAPDGTAQRLGFIYDNALAVSVFLARGTADDMRRAKIICDAFLWYQQHDTFADGRLRQAYYVDQNLTTATHPAIATWFSVMNSGENAFVGEALLSYFEHVRNPSITDPLQDPNAAYFQGALSIAQFLATHTYDSAQPGFFAGYHESPSEITVGVPIASYGTVGTSYTTIRIPLSAFSSQDLNLERLKAVSLVFNEPTQPTGTITFQSIKFVNTSSGTSLTVDNFSDNNPVQNGLGLQIGGIVDISGLPSGARLRWNNNDGSIDWWYTLLANPNNPPRLDASNFTHLELKVSGAVGGERFRVELQGYRMSQDFDTTKVTEHNIDLYPFFMRLYDLTGNAFWKTYADSAKQFLETVVWDASGKKFWVGKQADGVVNIWQLAEDVQSWSMLSLGRVSRFGPSLAWAENNLQTAKDGFTGFDFGFQAPPAADSTPDGVWFEGTGHMAVAYEVSGHSGGPNQSAFFLNELDRAQASALHANGKAIVAASHDNVSTGFGWGYYAAPSIAATSWYLLAIRHANPYWGTSTDAAVPHDNLAPTITSSGSTSINEGQSLAFTVTASDPDNANAQLVYSADNLPSRASFNASTHQLSWTPTYAQSGSYTVNLHVTDPYGLADNKPLAITVANVVAPAPVVTVASPVIGTQTVNRASPIPLSGTATAAAGGVINGLNVTAINHATNPPVQIYSSPISFASNQNSVSWSATLPANLAPGALIQVTVSATADVSLTTAGQKSFTINAAGQTVACYVLSAAFGRPDAPAIQVLFKLHQRLVPDWYAPWHRSYLNAYDRFGPRLAVWLQDKPAIRALIRLAAELAAKLAGLAI